MGYISGTVGLEIHGAQVMNPTNFDDPQTVLLVPALGSCLWFYVTFHITIGLIA